MNSKIILLIFLSLGVSVVYATMFSFIPKEEESKKYKYDDEPSNIYIQHFLNQSSLVPSDLSEQGFGQIKNLDDVCKYVGKLVCFKSPHAYYKAVSSSISLGKEAWKYVPFFGFIECHINNWQNGLGFNIDFLLVPYSVSGTMALNTHMIEDYGPLFMRETTKEEMEGVILALEEKNLVLTYGGEEELVAKIRKLLDGESVIPHSFLRNYRAPQRGDSSLHTAVKRGDFNLVKEQVLHSAEFCGLHKNDEYYTPLTVAALCGEVEIFEFLLEQTLARKYVLKLDRHTNLGVQTMVLDEILHAKVRIAQGYAREGENDLPDRLKRVYDIIMSKFV